MSESTPESEESIERNMGVQPLDAVMREHALENHHLVTASAAPLTHKAVQRARKGRRLTSHMQRRITEALHLALTAAGSAPEEPMKVKDLFTY